MNKCWFVLCFGGSSSVGWFVSVRITFLSDSNIMRGFIGAGVDGGGCSNNVGFFLAWRSFILCLFFSNFCCLAILSFCFNRDDVVVLEDRENGLGVIGGFVLSFCFNDIFVGVVPCFCFNRRVALAILAARAVLAATFDARVGDVDFFVGDVILGLGEDEVVDGDSFDRDLSAILALRAADADCLVEGDVDRGFFRGDVFRGRGPIDMIELHLCNVATPDQIDIFNRIPGIQRPSPFKAPEKHVASTSLTSIRTEQIM
jgi:hypothetical protein